MNVYQIEAGQKVEATELTHLSAHRVSDVRLTEETIVQDDGTSFDFSEITFMQDGKEHTITLFHE